MNGAPLPEDGRGATRSDRARAHRARTREAHRALDAAAQAHGWTVARGFLARLAGWMGRRTLDPRAGLCLPACRAVHTFGMRVAIDVVFVDRDLRVVRCVPALAPRRLAATPGVFAVIELPAGAAARRGLRPGRVLGPHSTLKEPSR